MLTAALEGAELSVLVATSGQAALDLLGHILPDLILMDAVMPGIDGLKPPRGSRRVELANVPVIFMTGLTESEHVVEAFEVGGTDYVRKPVNLMELIARVRVHMAQSRAMHASVASLDATGRLMMATDAQGRMLWCTPRAEQAMAPCARWNRETGLPPSVSLLVERLLQRGGKPGSSVKGEFGKLARIAGDRALSRK
jgi:DNA-binding response OmpR family regulator